MSNTEQLLIPSERETYARKEKKIKQIKSIEQSLTPGKTKSYARKGLAVKGLSIVTL